MVVASPRAEAWKWGGERVFHQHKVEEEAIYLNGGTFACEWWRSLWASEALTNWSNQLIVVCVCVCVCVCVVEATNVSFACLLACLLAFNGWGKSWSVVLCLASPTQSTYPFPHCPQHTPDTQNKWTNDKTLKKISFLVKQLVRLY
jgi:hypothetical protein